VPDSDNSKGADATVREYIDRIDARHRALWHSLAAALGPG
jgi:hypothetical protein